MSTLNELLGTSNLDEEQPWMNKKATIYGLVLSALVRLVSYSKLASEIQDMGRILTRSRSLPISACLQDYMSDIS